MVLLRTGEKKQTPQRICWHSAVISAESWWTIKRYNQQLETHFQLRAALPQFPVCSLILLLAEPPMGGVPGLNRHVDRNINKVPPPLPHPPHASSVDSCVLSCSLRSPMCANTHAHVGHLSWCTQTV